jgi:hypothetical protein
VIETETVYRDIDIRSEELKAVITVKENNNGYLVFSAENSEGRGLLLDRSVWLFEGVGDNESTNTTTYSGVIKNTSSNWQVGGHVDVRIGNEFAGATIGGSFSGGKSYGDTDYSNYTQTTDSFSSSNIHTGAICRRYFEPNTRLKVTLLVYRMEGDGSIKAESVTALINANQAIGVVK